MAVTTAAVIGIGTGIASAVQGFTAASKAKTAQQNADNEEQEERARDMVIKLRSQIDSESKFYKDATVKKAKADARG